MTAATPVVDAFNALVLKLEALYGNEHNHDFQAELDALEAAITAAPVEEEQPVKE